MEEALPLMKEESQTRGVGRRFNRLPQWAIVPLMLERREDIWEVGDFGKGQGHAAIRELFQGFQKKISFSPHRVLRIDCSKKLLLIRSHDS